MNLRTWAITGVVVAALAFFMWAVDFVTLEGEWTIYTVRCQSGDWRGEQCTGTTQPAERYRFRALKKKGEVLFWTVGATEASGKLSPCVIQSRSEWICEGSTGADADRSITLAFQKGRAQPRSKGGNTAFHAVSKARWYLLRMGIDP